MKYYIGLLVIVVLGLSGCETNNQYQPDRIRTKEWKHVGGGIISIIEIDDVEYVLHSRGGIVKHESSK